MDISATREVMGRRDFLKASGAAVAFLAALEAAPEQAIADVKPMLLDVVGDVPGAGPDADVLIRMYADLRRALEKPASERHWIMVPRTSSHREWCIARWSRRSSAPTPT
jgi:hypothetical protein